MNERYEDVKKKANGILIYTLQLALRERERESNQFQPQIRESVHIEIVEKGLT